MASAQALVDHDQIRKWADARGARPACVKGTGGRGDTGMIRLDFPGFSGAESLQGIPWKQWFRQFDANNLALLVQEKTARGQKSNFNKLVSRGGESRTSASERANATKARASRSAGSATRQRAAKAERKNRTTRRTAASTSGTAGRKTPNRSAPRTSSRRQGGQKTARPSASSSGQRRSSVKSAGLRSARKKTSRSNDDEA